MRTGRVFVLAGLLALGATPLASHADSAEKALDACVRNFVETSIPKDRPVRVEKDSNAPRPFDIFAKRKTYTVTLTARTKSGEKLSTARCVASPQGYVILLDTKPADSMFAG